MGYYMYNLYINGNLFQIPIQRCNYIKDIPDLWPVASVQRPSNIVGSSNQREQMYSNNHTSSCQLLLNDAWATPRVQEASEIATVPHRNFDLTRLLCTAHE